MWGSRKASWDGPANNKKNFIKSRFPQKSFITSAASLNFNQLNKLRFKYFLMKSLWPLTLGRPDRSNSKRNIFWLTKRPCLFVDSCSASINLPEGKWKNDFTFKPEKSVFLLFELSADDDLEDFDICWFNYSNCDVQESKTAILFPYEVHSLLRHLF